MSSCSSLSLPSSLLLSLSGSPTIPLSERKKQKKICLSMDIVRHISEFLEWKDLRLTRESYKVSPVSILASMVDSGDCRDEVFDFLSRDVNDDANRKLLSLVNNKEGQ